MLKISVPSFSSIQIIVHFRKQHFSIRQIFWRFLFQNISDFRNIAVTQNHLMLVCNIQQSPCRFGSGKDYCGKQDVCINSYTHGVNTFRSELHLPEIAHHHRWKYPLLRLYQQKRPVLYVSLVQTHY